MITIDRPYTGHVSPGSNPQQRDLEGARVLKMAVGAMDNNVYLVQCAATGAALLIDAANEPERILELVAQEAPGKIKLIVTTHQHPDHWWALEEVAKTLGVPTAAHRLDADPLPVTPDRYLEDGDVLEIGDLPLTIHHLRGHTPGSIALALPEEPGRTHLFTGDSLFPGGVGKTHNPEDFTTLLADVTTKLFAYPDDTVVYPGHGDDTTLGVERPHLEEWRERGW
ncbi:MBL fold metallo-hydrolase [Nocardia puris]|uniref:Glyoxylase-like metal-dependent hydrolase (Beta-lactamase superfamily II) n=1 Tax=Nocardia puris TaxID=208602 RepID=A0A366DEG3_9NOCA|nr:MBL fold metallo-hydrolase [Nocardia puris]MBF6212139.1 MBL fold metallo-hydrolase [Nocardia puris]MBF6367165.1 MBL fold metallo-hydrolase [Nocardia puris]MBF6461858.1 MBL fold metallo-hydrolase [Nocardia puris]RBO88315.1 glyoxylase-like metal-dependent hydrolase (beta-lactamase superfamily II) [Nocardia puris]